MFLAARQRVARPALALATSRRELATNTGKVKWFNTTRGYGFLTQEDGSDVFVHHTGIVADGYRSLADNEPVEFDIELQPNGKQAAVNVTGPNGAPVQGAERPMQRDNYDRDFY